MKRSRRTKPPRGAALLRKFRERAGLTQLEVGTALAVSGVTVCLWEKGTYVPKAHHRDRIALWTGDAVPVSAWEHAADRIRIVPFVAA
jgi:DNA-binding XRE family transcriptional regulator